MEKREQRILIIDDRIDQRALFEFLTEKLNFPADIVGSWVDAENLFFSKRYDVVLMDLQMPGMDGLEATAIIRAHDEQTKRFTAVIAVTARAMYQDREKCLEAGMDDYLSKPFKIAELTEKIQFWLSESLRRNESLQ